MKIECAEFYVDSHSISISTMYGNIVEWTNDGEKWTNTDTKQRACREQIISAVQDIIDRILETECEPPLTYERWMDIMVQIETTIEKVVKL